MPETRLYAQNMGWVPDYPDFRDFTPEADSLSTTAMQVGEKDSVKKMMTKLKLGSFKAAPPAAHFDLRGDCSPIEDQGSLGSCTAQAGAGMVEYFERRAFGKHIDASRLFLYKVTRNLLHWTGDTGAYLRTTMGAMALFGVPPEEYWPYVIADFDVEPAAFQYSFASNYQALQYFRLDPPGLDRKELLKRIKLFICARLPLMFGFTVYNSIWGASSSGEIPYPGPRDRRAGGHAIVAVGFDDKKKIAISNSTKSTTGALLIRNSWGVGWGDDGYGWLPYEYVLDWLAVDWWSLLKNEWVDTGRFGLGS